MEQYKCPTFVIPNPRIYSRDYDVMKKALQFFSIYNCLIFLGSSELAVAKDLNIVRNFQKVSNKVHTVTKNVVPVPILDHIEPIYSTPFSIYFMPRILYNYWKASIPNSNLQIFPSNRFLYKASDFYIIDKTNSTPEQISNISFVKTWIYPVIVMNNPLLSVKCELRSQNFKTSLLYSGIIDITTYNYICM